MSVPLVRGVVFIVVALDLSSGLDFDWKGFFSLFSPFFPFFSFFLFLIYIPAVIGDIFVFFPFFCQVYDTLDCLRWAARYNSGPLEGVLFL